jgi:hypothetical protein
MEEEAPENHSEIRSHPGEWQCGSDIAKWQRIFTNMVTVVIVLCRILYFAMNKQ